MNRETQNEVALAEEKSGNVLSESKGYKETKLGSIPEDWEILEFEEFAERSKATYSNKKDSENYKCVELEHINQETGSINGWTDSIAQKSTKTRFATGQVLFGKLRPYLRKFWRADFNGVCSTEIWVIDGKQAKSKNNFLFYLIQSNRFIQAANATSGSKMPRADWWYVSKFPFIIPPLPKQQKIAKILSTWDKAIATQEKLIAEKQALKKGLMQELLTGKKRFPGFTEKWGEVKLEDVCNFRNGKGHEQFIDADGKYVVVNSKFISSSGMVRKYTKIQASPLYKDDIVMVMSDVPNGKALAKCYLIEQDEKFSLNQRICSLSGKNINTKFLYYQLNRNRFYLKFNDGLSQTNLKKKEVLGCPILLPSLEEQEKIVSVIEASGNLLKLLEVGLENMIKQKLGLMQQLLTGEKRVKI